ncbi:MAG: GNAT family N-acetyltransferase [Mizugakiibacter sp.]|uniref:GNAT family N-acetyltransferase n=1 Tax=Mizugakiibacter sp. TaxID=1972610 RepID=UPI0031BC8934|nr:GNAT family N-acetyltransferase [Xanthomonadaceae bacterium]
MAPTATRTPERGAAPRIRPARDADCAALTALVRGSSAYAGEYRRIVETVAITPEQIARDVVRVAERDGRLAGFYSLLSRPGEAELDYLFVDDVQQGSGVGAALFRHMLDEAAARGFAEVLIVAHPPARAFYERMGARIRGEKPPAGRVGWTRPVLAASTSRVGPG